MYSIFAHVSVTDGQNLFRIAFYILPVMFVYVIVNTERLKYA